MSSIQQLATREALIAQIEELRLEVAKLRKEMTAQTADSQADITRLCQDDEAEAMFDRMQRKNAYDKIRTAIDIHTMGFAR